MKLIRTEEIRAPISGILFYYIDVYMIEEDDKGKTGDYIQKRRVPPFTVRRDT